MGENINTQETVTAGQTMQTGQTIAQTQQITQVHNMPVKMNDILNASFGEIDNHIAVSFKKTCLVRPYETEVVEADASVNIDKNISGIERMFIVQLLEAQVEYATYVNLLAKGLILEGEFETKKKALEESVSLVKLKADALLGKGIIDKYLNI